MKQKSQVQLKKFKTRQLYVAQTCQVEEYKKEEPTIELKNAKFVNVKYHNRQRNSSDDHNKKYIKNKMNQNCAEEYDEKLEERKKKRLSRIIGKRNSMGSSIMTTSNSVLEGPSLSTLKA